MVKSQKPPLSPAVLASCTDDLESFKKMLKEHSSSIRQHDTRRDISNQPPKRDRFTALLGVILIVSLVVPYYQALHFNSYQNGYHMDDVVGVYKNKDVTGSSDEWSWYNLARHDYWGLDMFSGEWTHKSFRPVTTLTFRLNYLLSGLDTSMFHLTNILLHSIASILVIPVGTSVMKMNLRESTLCSILFAVHPVHTESILYLVGRADVLCLCLMLVGILAWERDWRLSAWLLAILAGLSKELGFMLFGVYVAQDLLLKHIRGRTILNLAIGIGVMALRHWYTEGSALRMSPQDNPIAFESDATGRRLSFSLIHGEYMRLLVFPRFLCYDYSLDTLPLMCEFGDVRFLVALTAYTTVASTASLALALNLRGVVLAGAFFLLSFVPMSNVLFPVGTVVGERLLYIPSFGFLAVLCGIIPKKFHIAMLLVWGLMLVRTIKRVDDWKTADHLTLVDGYANLKSAKTQFNLGVRYFSTGDFDNAMAAFERSWRSDPEERDAIAFWRAGQIEIIRGNFARARELLTGATTKYGAKLMVKEEEVFHDAAVACFHDNRRIEEAMYYMTAALTLNRDFPKALNNLGCIQWAAGDREMALNAVAEAAESAVDNVIYWGNLWALSELAGYLDVAQVAKARALDIQADFVPNSDCTWEFMPDKGGP
ncbi:Protein O-mannosyl-transferase tmtc3 [Perkinsus chesapeaki]|uniref:dolichyl-phosphate-mannose--protein mannosyltransferase n=1 Tax=Perkinsus chesapeaki TaxID=330153 RepID=A0A7J6MIC6_PERCH|nr:Protein O-mannosyl-transferase tmtc3 [Perkinsus chesapeaki]